MNNSNVAHIWASQSRGSASGSHFYAEGRTIYSYGAHFPIATFTDKHDANGERVVLMTSKGYSNTTAKHIGLTRNALHGLNVRVLPVVEVDESEHAQRENLDAYISEFNALLEKASRARLNAAHYMAEAERTRANAADYCAVYGLEFPQELDADISPELLATLKQRANDAAIIKAQKLEAARAARSAEYAEKIAAWRAGADQHTSELWRFAGEPTALRLNGKVIETSRGADVPVTVARKMWRYVCRAKSMEKPMFPDMQVGAYRLRSIGADGSVVIGCHAIPFNELQAMAAQLGLIK